MTDIIGGVSSTTEAGDQQPKLRRKTRPAAGDLRFGRSSVSNGRRLHIQSADADNEGQRQQARRCATIALACERLESDSAAGKEIDLPLYSTLTRTYGQAIQRLYDLKQREEMKP